MSTRTRLLGTIGALTAAALVWMVADMTAQGRGGGKPAPGGGTAFSPCPEDIGPLFEQCAQELMKTYQPPRTEDGLPDFRGYWRRVLQSMTLEARGPDMPERRRSDGRRTFAIIDPPSGLFPYQPWAKEQAELNFKLYIDAHSMLYPPGGQRWPYISSGNYQILQPRGEKMVALMMEEIHLFQVIWTDGRPHLPANIKLYDGDWIGTWEGNTLVIDITNNNGETDYDQALDFISDSAHIVQRWTRIADNTLHLQTTVTDPKVFTQPMKFSVAWIRPGVDPDCAPGVNCDELLEESSFEGDRDLPTMFKTHSRYPGFTGLPAAKGR